MGPSGVGKTTTAIRCILSALERGQNCAYFLFDEGLTTLLARADSMSMNLQPFIDNGQLSIRQIDPAEVSPGEFSSWVRKAVMEDEAAFVVIDSLNAYLQAMPGEKYLLLQMHELLNYLNQLGIATLLVLGQHGLVGDMRTDVDLSYLSDTILLFRFFEAKGQILTALSVVKSRASAHERTIREFRLGPHRRAGRRSAHRFPRSHGGRAGLQRADGDAADGSGRFRAAYVTANLDQRVLVLAPRGRDAAVIAQTLDGSAVQICTDVADVARQVAEGAGTAIFTEEALVGQDLHRLAAWLRGQPPWSDLPIIVLAAHRVGPRPALAQQALADLGNIVIFERPINPETLQRGVASALRARGRQYVAREHLEERRQFAATLEQRIDERTADLARANLRLTREIEEKERMQAVLGAVAEDGGRGASSPAASRTTSTIC